MQSLTSILAPTASAARHLGQALATARTDFTTQANRTRRRVAGEIDHARDDVGEAATRLGEVLGDAVAAIQEASATYREDARRFYEKRGGDNSRAVAAMRRHPYVTASIVVGLGYFVLRAWRARRARHAESAKAGEREEKISDDALPAAPRARRVRSQSSTPRKTANGADAAEAQSATR
jgi:hypothetical protein